MLKLSFICESANNDTPANEKAQILQDAMSCSKKDIHLPPEYIAERKRSEKIMAAIILLFVFVPFGLGVLSLIND